MKHHFWVYSFDIPVSVLMENIEVIMSLIILSHTFFLLNHYQIVFFFFFGLKRSKAQKLNSIKSEVSDPYKITKKQIPQP